MCYKTTTDANTELRIATFGTTRYYDPRYKTREQGQMLIIPHVRESDSGEYCCIATNGIGEPAKSCGALQLKMSTSTPVPLSHTWSLSRFFMFH